MGRFTEGSGKVYIGEWKDDKRSVFALSPHVRTHFPKSSLWELPFSGGFLCWHYQAQEGGAKLANNEGNPLTDWSD